MNPNLTEIAFVMDRSGSMEAMKAEAIGGFNAFIESQKQLPGDVRFTLILFDNEYLKPIDHIPLATVAPLTDKTFEPRGTTALLDAMGRTVEEIGERLAKTPEAERPGKVIIACMTDGEENASQKYTNKKVAKMIEHQRTTYSWEFVFLGATLESRNMAKSWTIADDDICDFEATPEDQARSYRVLHAKVASKRAPK